MHCSLSLYLMVLQERVGNYYAQNQCGRLMMMAHRRYADGLWQEEIRAEQCPKKTCAAAPGNPCDWFPDNYLPAAERRERMAEGRSHYERMLTAQGHDPARAAEIARANREANRKGRAVTRHDDGQPQPSLTGWMVTATLAPCRKHQAAPGEPCTRAWVCRPRKHAAAEAAARGSRPPEGRDRASAREDERVRVIQGEPCNPTLFAILGPCGGCVRCLGLDPMEIARLFGGDVVLAGGTNYDDFASS